MNSGIVREGTDVIDDDKIIGKVTSGTYSPALKKGIGFCYVPKSIKLGDTL